MSGSAPYSPSNNFPTFSISCRSSILLFSFVAPVLAAILLYQLDSFHPAAMPLDDFSSPPLAAPSRNDRMLRGAEVVGLGVLQGPEDIVYDPESKIIYTGCEDGWIKRVTLNNSAADSVIQGVFNTGGRPLGLALRQKDIIVADAYKGLLKVKGDSMEVLTDQAGGRKFRLTDAVDVADNGIIYFTDASYKYNLSHYLWDILEGKPHGRLMSYDPETKKTKVLVNDLFFANGVAVSPDQTFVVFCETPMRRCRKYHIKGQKSGSVDNFIENLPGMPDNIHYDEHGLYWIALATEFSKFWDLAFRYPFIRKVAGIMEKYIGLPHTERNGGVLAVNLEGKPIAHYLDPALILVSSGIRIGNYIYCGSIYNPYVLRLDINQHPALPVVGARYPI